MSIKKYKKEVLKVCRENDFELIREKNHFVFKHEITNRKLTVPKTPSCPFSFRKTLRNIKHHNEQYLRVA